MKLAAREKKVVGVGAVVALLIIAWYAAAGLVEKKAALSEAYEAKRVLMDRYARQAESEGAIARRLEEVEKEVSALEAGLMSASTPVLATATLQSIVEGVLKPRGVEIKNIKALKAKDMGEFKAVGVEVTFYSSTSALVEILYEIENHREAVYIDHIGVRLQGGGVSPLLRVVMEVGAGYRAGGAANGLEPAGRSVL